MHPARAEDSLWMARALEQARLAAALGEVPVGAVVVAEGRVLGRGHNRNEALQDPTAHAEMVAITQAAEARQSWRLDECTLYVTLEPCTMCAGALVHARIERLVFAAREPRAGVVCSTCRLLDEPWYNHRVEWTEGVLAEESTARLTAFFQARR